MRVRSHTYHARRVSRVDEVSLRNVLRKSGLGVGHRVERLRVALRPREDGAQRTVHAVEHGDLRVGRILGVAVGLRRVEVPQVLATSGDPGVLRVDGEDRLRGSFTGVLRADCGSASWSGVSSRRGVPKARRGCGRKIPRSGVRGDRRRRRSLGGSEGRALQYSLRRWRSTREGAARYLEWKLETWRGSSDGETALRHCVGEEEGRYEETEACELFIEFVLGEECGGGLRGGGLRSIIWRGIVWRNIIWRGII